MAKKNIISWIVLIALCFTIGGLFYQNSALTQKLEAMQDKKTTEFVKEAPKESEKNGNTKIIESFFNSQYNYSSENYSKRLSKAKEYATTEFVEEYKETLPSESIDSTVNSQVQDLQIGVINDNEYLVFIKTIYSINGVAGSAVGQLFRTITKDNKINQIENIGSITTARGGI